MNPEPNPNSDETSHETSHDQHGWHWFISGRHGRHVRQLVISTHVFGAWLSVRSLGPPIPPSCCSDQVELHRSSRCTRHLRASHITLLKVGRVTIRLDGLEGLVPTLASCSFPSSAPKNCTSHPSCSHSLRSALNLLPLIPVSYLGPYQV